MKKIFFLVTFCGLLGSAVDGQTQLNPVIKNYGAVYDVPFAKDKPDPSMVYKIIVEVAAAIEKPQEIYAPLEHISRMYNLHVYSGIPQRIYMSSLSSLGHPLLSS